MIRRIIFIFFLIVSILFIQSNIYSLSCNLSLPPPASEKIIQLGCLEDDCYFRIFNVADVSSGFSNCEQSCKFNQVNNGVYNYENYRGCIESCIDSYVTNPKPINKENNLNFITTACNSKKTHLELGADLKLEMKSNISEIKVSGIDSIVTNGNDILLDIKNTNKNSDKIFNFDLNLIISGNHSYLKVIEEPLTESKGAINNIVEIKIKDLIIKEESFFNFEYFGKKPVDYDSIDSDKKGIESHSENFKLLVDNIYNYGTFNLDIKTGDGKKGYYGREKSGITIDDNYPINDGGKGGNSGDITIVIKTINNFGDILFNLKTGDGGEGGNGLNQSNLHPITGQIGHGGDGGFSGNINFLIDEINNKIENSNLKVVFKTGKGGQGGNTGRDEGSTGFAINTRSAGRGGNSGSLIFNINQIKNNGFILFDTKLGLAGNGGDKVGYSKHGNSYGGNAGKIEDIYIGILENNNKFTIDFLDGLNGIKGDAGYGYHGLLSNEMNLTINYLINRSLYFNIILKTFNETINSNKLIINRLETGSYLPNKVITVNKPYVSNRDINFNLYLECLDDFYNCNTSCGIDIDYEDGFDYNSDNSYDTLQHYGVCAEIVDEEERQACLEDCYNFCKTNYYDCIENLEIPPEELTDINLDNREIIINSSCYIRKPIKDYEYTTEKLIINTANYNDFKDFIPESILKDHTQNNNCAICDYFDLKDKEIFPQNTIEKFLRNYSLYSTVSGKIETGDLEIYYARNTSDFIKINSFNPFEDEDVPLYVNTDSISSEFNESLGLYEYKITPEKLKWYYDPNLDLSDRELFCYYQNYIIKGQIINKSVINEFNFPFTPLFRFIN